MMSYLNQWFKLGGQLQYMVPQMTGGPLGRRHNSSPCELWDEERLRNCRWKCQTFHTRKRKLSPDIFLSFTFPCDLLWTWSVLNICAFFACVLWFPQPACKRSAFLWPQRSAESRKGRLVSWMMASRAAIRAGRRAARRQMDWQALRKHISRHEIWYDWVTIMAFHVGKFMDVQACDLSMQFPHLSQLKWIRLNFSISVVCAWNFLASKNSVKCNYFIANWFFKSVCYIYTMRIHTSLKIS